MYKRQELGSKLKAETCHGQRQQCADVALFSIYEGYQARGKTFYHGHELVPHQPNADLCDIQIRLFYL